MTKSKLDYPIGGIGYVLVEVDTRWQQKTGYKGIGGKDLIVDTRYEPIKHVQTFGRVIRTPYAMGEKAISQISIGVPGYGPVRATREEQYQPAIYAIGGVYKYRRLSDISPEVNVGDTIWFQHTVLNRDQYLVDEIKEKKGTRYIFKVDYDLIICVDGDRPKMIGGWCFLESLPWKEITISGLKMLAPPVETKARAILAYAGTPLNGEKFYFNPGAKVFIRKPTEWRYAYRGKEYILTKQWDLMAELIED